MPVEKSTAIVGFDRDDPDASDFVAAMRNVFGNRVSSAKSGYLVVKLGNAPDADVAQIWTISQNERCTVAIGYPKVLR